MKGFHHSLIGFLIVSILSLIQFGRPQEVKGGPIHPCELNNQLIADSYSCTRYHLCRQLDGTEEFTTDIAICSSNTVFDMVRSECVAYDSGFLQDPAGCTTFYGCHPTRETSEGYLRRHYTCPGFLRFNPEEKFCTFKTNVTDDLCNSREPDQRIIGDVNRIRHRENANGGGSFHLTRTGSPMRHNTKEAFINNRKTIISSLTRLDPIAKNPKAKSPTVVVPPNPKPITEANLDRIAQVISGQLLSLQNKAKTTKKEGKETLQPKQVEKKEKKAD